MPLRSLQTLLSKGLPVPPGANNTEQANPGLSTSLLDTFVPGYGPIHKFFLYFFGFDITVVVSLGIVLWLVGKSSSYIWHTGRIFISRNYMSSVVVSNYDDIYDHLMKWLAEHPKIKSSRSLMAETNWKSAWEVDEEDIGDLIAIEVSDDDDNIDCLNFASREAKAPPRFIPAFGTHRIWHRGRLYTVTRMSQTVQESGSFSSILTRRENLVISCFGRSTDPIKEILREAKDFFYLRHQSRTVIRRPAPKDARRYGSRSCWIQIAHRPCRPMATVVLDSKRKKEVLADMNEFLHPATARWYANRGIPYRRGYLFHGPPGTGKTSLSFALAGVFGLNIYVISLLEPSMTEEDLEHLFNSLPRRCIVLLEDIDAAGLHQRDKLDDKDSTDGSKQVVMADLAKVLKKAKSEDSEDSKKKGISLSGLLNAIDGVASHEGRVLVMTSNHPEKLDDALIRPGRVDLQVAFGNATQRQIFELFIRMYSNKSATDRVRHAIALVPLGSDPKQKFQSECSGSDRLTPPLTPVDTPVTDPFAELKEQAQTFANRIPSGEFSPAEIQGFLLKRKKDASRAVAEVEAWVKSVLELRRARTKVLDVQ